MAPNRFDEPNLRMFFQWFDRLVRTATNPKTRFQNAEEILGFLAVHNENLAKQVENLIQYQGRYMEQGVIFQKHCPKPDRNSTIGVLCERWPEHEVISLFDSMIALVLDTNDKTMTIEILRSKLPDELSEYLRTIEPENSFRSSCWATDEAKLD